MYPKRAPPLAAGLACLAGIGGRDDGALGLPVASAPCCAILPGRQPVEPARRPARRSRSSSAAYVKSMGPSKRSVRRFHDPLHDRRREPAQGSGELLLPAGVRSRAISDSAERARRARCRPARDRARPRSLPALRAVQGAAARGRQALASGRGRDLEPALEPPPAARLHVGGRGRPADPARASRATTRSRPARSTMRSASRPSSRATPTSIPPATATGAPKAASCPRWGRASGSRRASTSRGSRRRHR